MSRTWSPADYQRRQEAGRCAFCSAPRGDWSICPKHRAAHRAKLAADREARRAAQLCQWGACGEPTGGKTYCAAHAEHRRVTRRDVRQNGRA